MNQNPSEQIWTTVLGQLQTQMTQATFETWLKETHIVSLDENEMVIEAKSTFAKDWLENRLLTTIKRTVTTILGRPVKISFIAKSTGDEIISLPSNNGTVHQTDIEEEMPETTLKNEIDSQPDEEASDLDATFVEDTDFHTIKKEMGRWLTELQYDQLFWGAYLGGQAWLFYRHLLMHWVKDVRKKEMHHLNLNKPQNHWTSPFKLSYRKAVKWLGKSNQKIIPGGMYECHQSDAHHRILKQNIMACCGAYHLHDWQCQSDESGGRCHYWRPGLIHRLHDEHLLVMDISKTGRATVQIWRNLPLLTPYQVERLNSFLQDEHERWIMQYGHLYNLTFDRWLEFTRKSHIPLQPGYDEAKQLHGHPPENPLLKKSEAVGG
ncbi:MAG: DnaA N-terminal domain-containing protein [Chloroflexota bacterium]